LETIMPTMSVSVGFRLRPDVAAKVRAIAEREGNTESAVFRRIVAEGLRAIGEPACERCGGRIPHTAAQIAACLGRLNAERP
jgi:hypothetical protein